MLAFVIIISLLEISIKLSLIFKLNFFLHKYITLFIDVVFPDPKFKIILFILFFLINKLFF